MLLLLANIFKKPISGLLVGITSAVALAMQERRPVKLGVGKEGIAIDIGTAIAGQTETKPVQGLPEKDSTENTVAANTEIKVPKEVENFGREWGSIADFRETLIQRDLQRLQLKPENPKTYETLIRHLAVTQVLLEAEQTYRVIFGSQIALLKSMNATGGCPKAAIEAVYNVAKARYPELYATYSLESYIGFLLSQNLIFTHDGEWFEVIEPGKGFLKWMIEMRLREDKPF